MLYLIFAGAVSLIIGMLLLFSPETIRNLNEKGNKALATIDEKVYSARIGVGLSLIVAAIFIFFMVYYIIRT